MSDEYLTALLDSVLSNDKWKDYGGLSADTMYGELAMDVARAAIATEREACAKEADDVRLANDVRLADDGVGGYLASIQHDCAARIASAIRARDKGEKG